MKLRLLLLTAVAALGFPAASFAARNVVATVVLTDTGTKICLYLSPQVADITSMRR